MPHFQKSPEKLKNFQDIIVREGLESLYVIADFDRTLTYGSFEGVKTPSIISLLRDGNHLSNEYARRAHELYDTYHAYEMDVSLSYELRSAKMDEWWEKHNDLLIASKLHQDDLRAIAEKNSHLRLRAGVPEFLSWCYQKSVPVIIFSASGAGDAIGYFLEHYKVRYPNIHFIANIFEWDSAGFALRTKGTLIHPLRKERIELHDVPHIEPMIAGRSNILLLGDSLSDLGMSRNFPKNHELSIGFLNTPTPEFQARYHEAFDIVIEGDIGAEELMEVVSGMK